jgi:biotin carboxyl carrier protein
MKLWALLGEGNRRHELDLEVRVEGDQLALETGGESVSAHVVALPDGESYSLLVGGRSYEVAIQEEGRSLQVLLDGRRFRVAVRSPLEKTLREVTRSAPASAGFVLEAPMPGLVVQVKVRPGERVRAGEPLVVMEAMKMQNELQAGAGGVVRDVLVAPGDSVEAGRRLVTVAPAEGDGA